MPPIAGQRLRADPAQELAAEKLQARRLATLIVSAAGPPEALYGHGGGAFELRRAASRLVEMQGREYLAGAHRPG